MSDYKDFEFMVSPIASTRATLNETGVIYIVDDEPEILEILSDIVKSIGFETMVFSDAREMVRAFETQTPDLVISDMKMPDMTGVEILKKVRSINPDVPVVLISGYLDNAHLIEAIASGVYSAIEKPFNPDQVVEVCKSAVQLCQTNKLLSRSLNLLMFHCDDIQEYLKSQGKVKLAEDLGEEVHLLVKYRRKAQLLSQGIQ